MNGIVAFLVWAALTALVCLWVKAATRRDDDVPTYTEPEDGVQPWDSHTVTLSDARAAGWVKPVKTSWTN